MKVFDAGKSRMIGPPCGENYDDMLIRFHLIPKRYGQTDGRTDRIGISISRVGVLTRDKNQCMSFNSADLFSLVGSVWLTTTGTLSQ